MWFNLTDQLNKKIEILGQILRGRKICIELKIIFVGLLV